MVNMTFTTIFTTNDLVLAEGLNIVPLKKSRGSYVTRAMGTENFLAREMVLENCKLYELGVIGSLKLSHSHDGVEKPDILRKRGYQEVDQWGQCLEARWAGTSLKRAEIMSECTKSRKC